MKLTKEQLREIIKEEITEARASPPVSREEFDIAMTNINNTLEKYIWGILNRLDDLDGKGIKV